MTTSARVPAERSTGHLQIRAVRFGFGQFAELCLEVRTMTRSFGPLRLTLDCDSRYE